LSSEESLDVPLPLAPAGLAALERSDHVLKQLKKVFDVWSSSVSTPELQAAERLRESVLSVGNTIDSADGYRAFRGRDACIDALMRERGFPVPAAAKAD
jgi:Zn-dependent oligopeptidase